MEKETKIDYGKEFEELNKPVEGTDYFKPKVGLYEIQIIEEPVTAWYEKVGEVPKEQIKMKILVNGEGTPKTWFIGKGKTKRSLYGQLMVVGKAKGQLKGYTDTLVVKASKNQKGETVNEYTLVRAVGLQAKEEVVQ